MRAIDETGDADSINILLMLKRNITCDAQEMSLANTNRKRDVTVIMFGTGVPR